MRSVALTTEEFVRRGRGVHGERYDYSLVDYKRKDKNVVIICREHGSFTQTPSNHVRQESGCMKCGGRYQPTIDEWRTQAQLVHGDRYDYSLVEYVASQVKVKIICANHGIFEQTPNNHVGQGQGCAGCAGLASPSTDEWIARARAVHGDRFDYDLVHYVNNTTRVQIACRLHGVFEQIPKSHIKGSGGCPKCIGRGFTTPEWITKAQEVHGDTYDYSQVEYVNTTTFVTIVCCIHGPFTQAPYVHVRDQCGCGKCAGYGLSDAEWIVRAREVHGDLYDYSEFAYVNQQLKCRVICVDHGPFEVSMNNHIGNRSGCPLCSGSKGEALVARVLDALGIDYLVQWSDPSCRDRSLLLFDFCLTEFKALIEFDGIQHFEPVRWCKSMTQAEAQAQFLATQRRDGIKNEWALDNGYALLRVRDLKSVETEVADFAGMLQQRSAVLKDVCVANNESGEL